jgi:EmrB/QacA subfamily drug resistance transporter
LIGLTAFSALCGFSWNIGSLITFRIFQGIFSGLIQISTMTIIYLYIEKSKQPLAISYWTVSMMFAPAIGPTLGGLITYYWGWEALFFSNVPIGVISIICAIVFLPASQKSKAVSFDILGLITVVIGNVSLLMYFTKGNDFGWFSVPAAALFITGIAGITTFIWRELTVKEPLLNISVFKYPSYALGTVINCLLSFGLYSSIFLIPLFMEEVQGVPSFIVGLVMLPGVLIMMIVSIITGKLHNKLDPFWFVLLGTTLLGVATWKFSQLRLNSSVAYITFWMSIRYIGLGLATTPVTNISMSVIPDEHFGHASSISNWTRQVLSALSIAIFSSILAIRTQIHLSELDKDKFGEALQQSAFLFATNDTFLVASIVLICAIPLSLLLKKTKELNKTKDKL